MYLAASSEGKRPCRDLQAGADRGGATGAGVEIENFADAAGVAAATGLLTTIRATGSKIAELVAVASAAVVVVRRTGAGGGGGKLSMAVVELAVAVVAGLAALAAKALG